MSTPVVRVREDILEFNLPAGNCQPGLIGPSLVSHPIVPLVPQMEHLLIVTFLVTGTRLPVPLETTAQIYKVGSRMQSQPVSLHKDEDKLLGKQGSALSLWLLLPQLTELSSRARAHTPSNLEV